MQHGVQAYNSKGVDRKTQNVIWGVGVQQKSTGPEEWGAEGWGPEGWGAQNFALLSLSRHNFLSFFPRLGVLPWNFGGVFEALGPEMCTFGVLGMSTRGGCHRDGRAME